MAEGKYDVVIAGAGQAGLQLVMSLVSASFSGSIALIGDEVALPYQRPPLSKRFLSEDMAAADLEIQPRSFYETHGVDLLLGDAIVVLDRRSRTLALASGRTVAYEQLVIATGARARLLPLPWSGLANVHRIRTADDAIRLRSALAGADDVAVVGGGFLGLEVAAACAGQGRRVHVVEGADRLLARSASPVVSRVFHELHRSNGVGVHLAARLADAETAQGRVAALHLADGTRIGTDMVLIAIGVTPNVEAFAAAGLEVDDGLKVDGSLRTSDPCIFAIGDCASFPGDHEGSRHIRVESVQNALDQAKHVAQAILGHAGRYGRTPVFWSEQFSTRLQVAGIAGNATHAITRGDAAAHRFSTYLFRSGRLVAVESVNSPADHMMARKLFARGVLPLESDLADPAFEPASLLAELQ